VPKPGLPKKDPGVGKDWRWETKGMTEDETVGWHQWTWVWENSGVGYGHGSLLCCSPWVSKSWTWLSDWTELKHPTESSDMAPQCLSTKMFLVFFFLVTWYSVNCFTYICLILKISLQAKFSIEPHFKYEWAESNVILGISGRARWWTEVPTLQLTTPLTGFKEWPQSSMGYLIHDIPHSHIQISWLSWI